MATMLRIGQHVINLDQVTHIDNLLPSVTVWFGERSTRFNGSDATQRHSWLAQHAQPISAPTPGTAADRLRSRVSRGCASRCTNRYSRRSWYLRMRCLIQLRRRHDA